jgi:hypothetical protein
MDEIERRVRKLERRLWWTRLALLGMSLLVVAIGYRVRQMRREEPALVSTKTIFAERVILKDELGNERAQFAGGPEGASLRMHDSKGRLRVTLDAATVGPGLTLKDGRGKERVLMAVERGGPFLGLTNEQGDDLFTAP